jgi:hypothetical protein
MPMKKNQLHEKKLLSAKLLSYSAAAGALVAIGSNAEAQIVYTDVDPDSEVVAPEVGSAGIFEIDMNNDGITDVTIVAGNGDWYYDTSTPVHWTSIRALPADGAEVVVASSYVSVWSNTYWLAQRFDADDLIGSDNGSLNYWSGPIVNTSGTWSWQLGFVGTSYSSYYNYGLWNDGETDKYLGIRFSLDEGVTFQYGWVRLDVADDHSQVTVKDYAYEMTADKAIAAGKSVNVSVRNGLANDLGVNIFSHQNKIVISDLEIDHATAKVYNVAGQLLHTVQVEKGRNEVPVDNKGLYIVRIDLGSEIVSSKVIVQ